MSPVHIMGIQPPEGVQVTKGAHMINVYEPENGTLMHCTCKKCGGGIYYCPKGAPFRLVYPTNFHIADGKNCKLPDDYLPTAHLNYENRLMDWHDPLPKFKTFPPPMGSILLNNKGDLYDYL